MTPDESDRTLDALKQALNEGQARLHRSRATLARTEALLGQEVANDNEAGRSGGSRRPDDRAPSGQEAPEPD